MAVRDRGKAFVEIVADTDRFEEALDRSLLKAVKQASRSQNFEPIVVAAEVSASRAGERFGVRFVRDARRKLLTLLTGKFAADVNSTLGTVGVSSGSAFADAFLSGFSAASKAAPITANLLRGASGLFASLAESGPVGIIGAIAAFLPLLGVLTVALPLVAGAFFAVGGALFSLIGLLGALPGPAFAAIAAVIPLVIAFQGFGDAISALVSGDMEKFNEELKKLSPSARAVAREFQQVLPFFKRLRVDVQEAFFSQLRGFLVSLTTALGPTVSGGLQNIAFAFGTFFGVLAKFAAKPETTRFLSDLFQFTASAISSSGPVLITFLGALTAIAQASLPILEQFGGKVGDAVRAFSEFLVKSTETGDFQSFLDSGLKTLEDLLGLGKELFGLLKDMFGTTDEAGRTFLQDVRDSVKELREFFQSPEGKKFIEDMIVLAKDFGTILKWVTGLVADLLHNFAWAIDQLDRLGKKIEELKKSDSFLSKVIKVSLGPFGGLPGFAHGGITDGPSIAGEAGPEAILPLDNPVRAREIASDPQVAAILGGGETTVIAIFDGEPFQARIVRTVRGATTATAKTLSQKPRFT